MINIITVLVAISFIVIVLIVLSIRRLSKLKRKRVLGRSISKIKWFDKLLLKQFARDFPFEE